MRLVVNIEDAVEFPADVAGDLGKLPRRFEPALVDWEHARVEVIADDGALTVVRCERAPLRRVLAALLSSDFAYPEGRIAALVSGWKVDVSRLELKVDRQPATGGLLVSKVDLRGAEVRLKSLAHPAKWASVDVQRLVFPFLMTEPLCVQWGEPVELGDLEELVR